MRLEQPHPWKVSVAEALAIQTKLASMVCRENHLGSPALIAGTDVSVGRSAGVGIGAVVVLSYPDLVVREVRLAQRDIDFPYVPGLLSFREAPLILATFERLTMKPDVIVVDGQGLAHPRRVGIASHLGLLLGIPTIGCAKSILCGRHQAVGETRGACAEMVDKGEVIGMALRTRPGAKPVYVSIGHRVDLPSAVSWIVKCCQGYRLPEPTRLAHLAAAGRLPGCDDAIEAGANRRRAGV
ncbi:MAG: deoxyribonuclease V [Chloroflexi bacterium]|nr:deoxyribonuclease V [Chloroflexota bacterium]